jgi:hypothetical protein
MLVDAGLMGWAGLASGLSIHNFSLRKSAFFVGYSNAVDFPVMLVYLVWKDNVFLKFLHSSASFGFTPLEFCYIPLFKYSL